MADIIQHAFALSGAKTGQPLTGDEIAQYLRDDALAWVHLDANDPNAGAWITSKLDYLDPLAIEALVAEHTRPRVTQIGNGVLLILRGVNTNAGADPEDMVSIRLWVDPNRIISLSRQNLASVQDVARAVQSVKGPQTAGGFVALLCDRLTVRIERLGRDLKEKIDVLEETITQTPNSDMRGQVVAERLRVIALRRHCAPQRDAIEDLIAFEPDWLGALDLRHLHEILNKLTRVIEEWDAMRERLTVLREELANELSERLNRNMYLIGVLSAVFLPLGFLTGLFGINLGGMPGASDDTAFWVFCGGLGVIFALQLLILLRMRWL